ncbi:MAG: hypothetical protein MK161_03490 [Pirellulales bacterium]|nr:hypothetical protein [Pirellulales bacterium]
MNPLEKQVAQARRRLVCEQFVHRLIGCLFFSFLVATGAIALPKILVIAPLPTSWAAGWLAGAGITGVVTALGWTFFSRHSTLETAIEIDQRYNLRERVASSLLLSAVEQETEAGQAVMNDAIRAASRIDIGQRFRLQVTHRAWLPLIPILLAFCLAIFVGNREATSKTSYLDPQETTQQVKQSVESLRKKIAAKRKLLENRGLKDAEGILKEIEKRSLEIGKEKETTRAKAVVKLNDLGKMLEKRRQQVGGKDALKRQFNKLKNLSQGPLNKIADAIKHGNFKEAVQQAEELQKQIAEGNLTEEQKGQLQKQLAQMQEKITASANAHQQAMDNLRKQIDEQRRLGKMSKVGPLQQKLDQLASQQPQTQSMQKMSELMATVQQSMKQGNPEQAAEAMRQMAGQLAQMQQDLEELEMLDAAMNELEMAKSAMGCKQCQGSGCKACQKAGTKAGTNAGTLVGTKAGAGTGTGKGSGMGTGTGQGPRADTENVTNLRDTRVRQKPGRGATVFGGFTEGGNVRGTVLEELKAEMASLGAEPADPLTNERLPRSRREHAEQYFRSLREGP